MPLRLKENAATSAQFTPAQCAAWAHKHLPTMLYLSYPPKQRAEVKAHLRQVLAKAPKGSYLRMAAKWIYEE